MCGIYGAIGKNYKDLGEFFSGQLHHRGPDDNSSYYEDDCNLFLGHTRLSVIDLSNDSYQPMESDSQDLVLVFNGEIYNYKDFKKGASRIRI